MSLNNTKEKSVFDEFTNKYALSKTLRFELKPEGKTSEMLEEANVFEKDHIIHEKYELTKPYLDRLHREFIKESLAGKKIDNLADYWAKFEAHYKNKKVSIIKKDFQNKEKELRKQLNNNFQTQELFSENVFGLLKEKYSHEEETFVKNEVGEYVLNDNGEKISIFDEWKGFVGYFTKFHETRKNFYKDDGTATAIVTRIVDENLYRFCENILHYKEIKNKNLINFTEVEEKLHVKLDNVFSLEYYNNCFLQEGIDVYNAVLGGKTLETGEKLKGVNELINKYRQDHKGEKINFFKKLDRQILSDKERPDFIKSIKDDKELLVKLKEFYANAEEKTIVAKKLLGELFTENNTFDLSKIYLSKEGLNTILFKWMNPEGKQAFETAIFEQNKKTKLVKIEDGIYKFPDFTALSFIKQGLNEGKYTDIIVWKERYYKTEDKNNASIDKDDDRTLWQQFIKVFKYEFDSLFEHVQCEVVDKKEVCSDVGYDIYKTQFEKLLARDEADFSVKNEDKLTIKNFVDNTLWIYQMTKYFAIEKKRKWLEAEYPADPEFYENETYGFRNCFYQDAYAKIVGVRMLLQSYLTKKPFNTDKWKLNFENPTLADGWDKNKESDNSAIILRKEGNYYLAVMKKGNNKIFDDKNKAKFLEGIENGLYEKMIYKLLPGASKMLPKVFFSKKNINYYNPSEKVLQIRNYATHTKNGTPQKGFTKRDFIVNDCHEMIDFYKKSIVRHPDWKNFNFKFSETSKYKDTSDFYREVENQGYKVFYEDVSQKYIEEKNESGELFLFKIHNKDWNLKDNLPKVGRKNVHTLYFEELFSEQNKADNFPFKLNGEAELFYRPKTDKKRLGNKLDKRGKEVVNHKRYSENKVFFHVPITLNRTKTEPRYYNQKINDFLVDNPDINIIGVDRGEKHLIYYAGIDQKGNILKDKNGETVLGSLNSINGVNYHKLLEDRAKNRIIAKQDWQIIEGIKDLKKGYISLVVRKLADLIIEHNAILVFEDLNMRFKQIRGGIEKSVYQQLEKALIDKLNFLVNKNEIDPQKAGHLLRAYQLTAPFTTFKDMGKQTGVIFYTQASYTSKTCPECGFRPNVRWDENEIMRRIIKENSIKVLFSQNHFDITYTLSDTQNPSKRKNILFVNQEKKKEFTVSTKDAIRYKWFKRDAKNIDLRRGEEKMNVETKTGTMVQYAITDCLKGLFEDIGVDLHGDIVKQVAMKQTKLHKKFFGSLAFYLHLLINTRSSVSGTDIDYINCPCCGFSSADEEGFRGVPFNGDANGAYNVARKGILVLKKLEKYKADNGNLEKMNWGDLFIDIEEWDKFSQSNN